MSNINPRESPYIPLIHLKGNSRYITIKENEEVKKIKEEREKEKEKRKKESNIEELREGFQTMLSRVESCQNLNMAEYVEAIKNNYRV